MNTSHGHAALPINRYRAAVVVAMTRARTLAMLIALSLAFGTTQAAGVNPDQPIRLDGMELFFGVIPAEILRGHPQGHEEQIMHGGIPRGKGVHHLIVSVFDSKTRSRITDAVVTGNVTTAGMAPQSQSLEVMTFGGAVSYGNYYVMPKQGLYEIVVSIRRSRYDKAATARFQYRHTR